VGTRMSAEPIQCRRPEIWNQCLRWWRENGRQCQRTSLSNTVILSLLPSIHGAHDVIMKSRKCRLLLNGTYGMSTDMERDWCMRKYSKSERVANRVASLVLSICDAAHEKVPNRRNGVIGMVVQRTYQGIKQNKNHSKIPSTFRYIEF